MKHSYEKFFPFKEIRDEQRVAIEFVLGAFLNSNKKYCLLELGTGVGKSAIAVAVARYLNFLDVTSSAYVLTTQRVLQRQYTGDFGPQAMGLLRSIESSANYKCLHYPDQSCAESKRIINKLVKTLVGTEFYECCRNKCPYTLDKERFIMSNIGVTNFSYFLSETMYAGKLEPRNLLIIDECHNVESEISKHIEVSVSERFANDALRCSCPSLKTQAAAFEWVSGQYRAAVARKMAGTEKLIKSKLKKLVGNVSGLGDITKQYEMLDKHICKLNRFVDEYDEHGWILNVVESWDERRKKSYRKFEFKPVAVSTFCHDSLYKFGNKVMMMSATIIDRDVFCRTVGLDVNDVAFLSLSSPFACDNRKVCCIPVGSMSKKLLDDTLPLLAKAIEVILDQHSSEKGIIHAQTYKIASYIKENVRSKRLLMHDQENREAVLKQHLSSIEPTVLLSPSMTEGIDLADDNSRFQILCKIPYPYLGDNVVKRRMALDDAWYDFQTTKTIVQALGRSVRNMNDYAVSYILDSDWDRFYRKNKKMFPHDFSCLLV